jgi:hypothetical protein
MASTSVSFNGTRVNDSTTNTNWGNWPSGGGAPSSEAQLAYQGGSAVNKKVTSATLDGIDYDPGAGALDMTADSNRLYFVKVIVADSFDLLPTYGVNIGLGSSVSDYYEFNMAGSNANLTVYNNYPSQGGYLITAIDPNITEWRENTVGTPDLTIVDWYGAQCALDGGGAAKAENLALDAIDIGTGLTIVGGDGVDADGTFVDFVDFDQDITTNRYGVVTGSGDSVVSHGLLTIGSGGTATVFTDLNSIVTFADGYHSRGLTGVEVNLDNSSNVITMSSLLIGNGSRNGVDSGDTRPDFTVVDGGGGSLTFNGQLRNFRDITFTTGCTITDSDIEGQLLVQGGSDISDTTLRTNSLSGGTPISSFLQDPTFGTTDGLHDVTFVQGGTGHAIEIDTTGSYNLTNLFFDGYGSTGTDSAAIHVTPTGGTVTLNIQGGDSPTYKTEGATVNVVVNPVTFLITVRDISTNNPIQNARVKAEVNNSNNFPYLASVTITTGSTGTIADVTHTSHGLSTGDFVTIRGANESEYLGCYSITATTTNSYEYTMNETPTVSPATGTITSTFAYFNTLTDSNGQVTDTRSIALDQTITGRVRKGTTAPFYKTQPITGTIDNANGLSLDVFLISDE